MQEFFTPGEVTPYLQRVCIDRGCYRSEKPVQNTWSIEHYIDAVFPAPEKGKPVIAPGISALLIRLQRFAPWLVDFGMTHVFRTVYGKNP